MKQSRCVRPLVVLGSTVNMVDGDFVTQFLVEQIAAHRQEVAAGAGAFTRQIFVTGFHGLYVGHTDPEYFAAGEDCDLWVPDSIAPVLIAKKRGMTGVSRTPGAEVMTNFFKVAQERGLSSFFYGDMPGTLELLKSHLLAKYPKLKVAGCLSPPFRALTTEDVAAHIRVINAAQPDVLWVGLGLPKQDLWIYRHKHLLKVPVASGVGAAFGFLAGTTKRAPSGWRKCGLEWLYMVLTKPRRTARRVLVDGVRFCWAVLTEKKKEKIQHPTPNTQ